METALLGDTIALITVYCLIIFFVVVAISKGGSAGFFFANQKLTRKEVEGSVAASATSAAGVLLFFFNQTSLFNMIVLLIPIFTVLGIYFFSWVIKDELPDPSKTGTISRFLIHKTGSQYLGKLVSWIILIQLLLLISLEIVLGSVIFGYFTGFGNWIHILSICLMVTLMCYYVLRGGMKAVTYTDGIQFWLIVAGLISTLGFLFFIPKTFSAPEQFSQFFSIPTALPSSLIWVFVTNVIVLNLVLPVTMAANWQRYSSGVDQSKIIQGYIKGILRRAMPIWMLAIMIAIFTQPSLKALGASGVQGIFDLLKASHPLTAMFSFPLLFAGIVAALISTIDSMFLALMLQYDDRNGSGDHKVRTSPSSIKVGYVLAMIVLLSSVALFYVLKSAGDLEQIIVNTLFIFYGLSAVLVPSIVIAAKKKIRSPLYLHIGLWVGIVTLILSTVFFLSQSTREFIGFGHVPAYFGNILGPVIACALTTIVSLFSGMHSRKNSVEC